MIDNLGFNVKKENISHPMFKNLVKYIHIIIQSEGMYNGTYGFNTDKFRVLRSLFMNKIEHKKPQVKRFKRRILVD